MFLREIQTYAKCVKLFHVQTKARNSSIYTYCKQNTVFIVYTISPSLFILFSPAANLFVIPRIH